MSDPILALDADGVLLDYHEAYARLWELHFGAPLPVADPLGYSIFDRFNPRLLHGEEKQAFRERFNHEFWSSIRPLPGALEACLALRASGFSLACVTAARPRDADARALNLIRLGFPFDEVVATGPAADPSGISPKAAAIARMKPEAFVDDFLPYFRGVPDTVHRALVDRHPNGSPNRGPEMELADSVHPDLPAFASFWIGRLL